MNSTTSSMTFRLIGDIIPAKNNESEANKMQEHQKQNGLNVEGSVEKMGKEIIAGCACIYFSNLTPEEMDRYKTYAPDALSLYNEDNEVIFTLDIDNGPGNITLEKAVLSCTKSADGKATVTILIDPEEEDKLGLIREKIGRGLLLMNDLEEQLVENVGKLNERQDIIDTMFKQL